MRGNRVGPRDTVLSQKSLQVHVLILQLPVFGAQRSIVENLALLLLVSTVPRHLEFVRHRTGSLSSMLCKLTMVPAMMNTSACTKSGWNFGADVYRQTPTYTKGQAPMSLSQMT